MLQTQNYIEANSDQILTTTTPFHFIKKSALGLAKFRLYYIEKQNKLKHGST